MADNFFYENIIRNILAGFGFSEIYNYSFAPAGEIELENPISQDKKYMRANLSGGLANNIKENFKYFDEVKIFEIGKTFRKTAGGLAEKNMLAGAVAYKKNKGRAEEFYEIKGVIGGLFSKLGISELWFKESSSKLAELRIGDSKIGEIDMNIFEIDLDKLIELVREEIEYRPVSKYPAVIRDIAIFVPSKTRVMEVTDIIENTAGNLLIDTDLFDIYESESANNRKKSFAFHLVFQSSEKTLTEKEINGLMDKIIEALEENQDWEVRK